MPYLFTSPFIPLCSTFIISLTHSVTWAPTLDPGCATKIRLAHCTDWIDSVLTLNNASPDPSLIYSPSFPHSCLVCQRAIVLLLQTRAHSPVSLSLHIASPFMPHSYALYPDDSRIIVTHPLCSLYAIGPCPFVTCDMTWSVPSIYRRGP
jgi:hypothetical protein